MEFNVRVLRGYLALDVVERKIVEAAVEPRGLRILLEKLGAKIDSL